MASAPVPMAMPRWMIATALAGAMSGVAVPTARAGAMEDAVPAIRQFGLLGTWGIDCGQTVSRDNPRVRFFVEGEPETVSRTLSVAPDRVVNRDAAYYAEIVPNDRIVIVLRQAKAPTTFSIIRHVDGGIQTVDAFNSEGKHPIQAGIMSGNGEPSQVYRRCSE